MIVKQTKLNWGFLKRFFDEKVDKVNTAIENNIAIFDHAGGIKDSGKKDSDYMHISNDDIAFRQYLSNNMNINYYVDGINGDDNNDGSEAHPFKNISTALEKIIPGSYAEIILKTNCTLTTTKSIRCGFARIKSATGEKILTLDGGTINVFHAYLWFDIELQITQGKILFGGTTGAFWVDRGKIYFNRNITYGINSPMTCIAGTTGATVEFGSVTVHSDQTSNTTYAVWAVNQSRVIIRNSILESNGANISWYYGTNIGTNMVWADASP